jgi:hypothetical protein
MSNTGAFDISSIIIPIQTLTGDIGGAVSPLAGNIDILGGNNITTTGTPATNTITIDVTGTTNHALQVGNGTGSLTSLGVATNGQIPIGSTGANPVLATLTSTDSSVTITNGAGSIDLSAHGGITWVNVTGATQAMDINTGYLANRVGGNVAFTLPVTAALGVVLAVAGSQNGWTIAQNAGQTIHFLGDNTTTGIGGSLASTTQYDCIELVCIVANTDFVVRNVVGNITIA